MWIHCNYPETKKIVFSSDTDTYHVGMGLLEDVRMAVYDIYVKLSCHGKAEKHFHRSILDKALHSRPKFSRFAAFY